MSSLTRFTYDTQPRHKVADIVTTFAERAALERRERAHQRSLQEEEQRAESSSPDVRIRAWEKLHGLRLPSDPDHPVLYVVAVSTRLTLAQVQDEQRARATRSRTGTP